MLDARHGGKRLGIKPKQPALEAGEVQNLVPTLATLREAVNAEPDRLQLGLRPLDVLQELERELRTAYSFEEAKKICCR